MILPVHSSPLVCAQGRASLRLAFCRQKREREAGAVDTHDGEGKGVGESSVSAHGPSAGSTAAGSLTSNAG